MYEIIEKSESKNEIAKQFNIPANVQSQPY